MVAPPCSALPRGRRRTGPPRHASRSPTAGHDLLCRREAPARGAPEKLSREAGDGLEVRPRGEHERCNPRVYVDEAGTNEEAPQLPADTGAGQRRVEAAEDPVAELPILRIERGHLVVRLDGDNPAARL